MPTPPPGKPVRRLRAAASAGKALRHLRASDLRGVARLATETTAGITRITEAAHQSVLGTLGVPEGDAPGRTRGITGLVYKSIHGVNRIVAASIDKGLLGLQPLFDRIDRAKTSTRERDVVLAILNGVMGDRLAATGNPLATPMTLRRHDPRPDHAPVLTADGIVAHPTAKIAVLVHGLCTSERHWRRAAHVDDRAQRADLGAALAGELGYTPVYLRYNTGLHVSRNGRELAGRLEDMVAHWPVPVDEVTLVGYSMGGLVARSACQYGSEGAMRWRRCLKNMVFLATPHHGAPLERAGNWLDAILGSTPYSAPYARLFQLRSAGITDLRYGHLLDEDWCGHDRFRRRPDSRRHLPLPAGVSCYAVAATTASRRSLLADRLVGDGLVPLHSALGQHDDARRTLGFARSAQWIGYRMQHMEVPGQPEVIQKVLEWLAPGTGARRAGTRGLRPA